MEERSNAPASVDDVVRAVRRLPGDRLPLVLRFVEFVEYQIAMDADDGSEDDALWQAVRANQDYQRRHPDDAHHDYVDGAAFLSAMPDALSPLSRS